MTTLLAKSPRGGRTLTLHQHLLDTEQAACLLFRAGMRWARAYLRFFKIPETEHARFLLLLRIAALFHDIGKANDGFLAAVSSKSFIAQSLRHEHLSAIVLAHPAVRAWLASCADIDIDIILAAVLSHHLKASQSGDWQVLAARSAAPTRLYLDDPQIIATLARIAHVAGLQIVTLQLPRRYDDPGWEAAWTWFWDQRVPRFSRELASPAAATRFALHLAVKAALIAADSVASAMFREDLPIDQWIEEVAHALPLDPDAIHRDILAPRIDQISSPTKPFKAHKFQDGAATVGRRGLLLAACGAGKTLAAWRWAEAISRSEPIGRVIFLYPTRGTATEGFRDYVGHAPEGTAALVHGTAAYELQGMQSNTPDLPPSLRGKVVAPDEAQERLFALGQWPKRYFSATVDQFLSFIEHGYGGLCLLPALADSAVVFDEIHSYDHKMWNALMAFLRRFDVPVLCMTATLPPARRGELANILRAYPDETERADLVDLEEAERHLRYRLTAVADKDEALRYVVPQVRMGQRVLWVVNTVKRCRQLARDLMLLLPNVLVYHSRFRLEDRQRRHRQTVDAFRPSEQGDPISVIAVTTQVCEMSLDLDADILVTEHAPISSLVQRFGRANRHLRRGREFRARLLTYRPESRLPYESDELAAAERFLAAFTDRDVSQRDLAEGLAAHSPPGRHASGETRFLDGGYFATPGTLRDSEDESTPVILDRDLPGFRELHRLREPTDGLRLSVPRKFARAAEEPGLPTWLMIADGDRYDPVLGFNVEDDQEMRGTR
jgi:CRISPR-associated endonuclease/helicase Cas3